MSSDTLETSASITFNQLSPQYISRLKDAFQWFDHDGDGVLDRRDLEQSLQSVGKDSSQVAEMLLDQESITFPQFITIMSQTSGEFQEDHIRECLQEFSPDLNVDKDELIDNLKKSGVTDLKQFDKLFQTFQKKGSFNGSQFLDTISER